MNLGIECEVFVVKMGADGRLHIPNLDDDLNKSCYDIKRFLDRFTWLDKVSTTIQQLGWDLYSLDHEDANSFEGPRARAIHGGHDRSNGQRR